MVQNDSSKRRWKRLGVRTEDVDEGERSVGTLSYDDINAIHLEYFFGGLR